MSKAHRLKTRKSQGLARAVPVNFLLGCSQGALGEYELARWAETADLRSELIAILDRLIEERALAQLAGWFQSFDRHDLKVAIENPDDIETIIQRAQEQIRDGQRSPEELLPLPSLPPGAAHLAAAVRYQERNIAAGLCRVCPKPLARNSVEHCEEHLAKARARAQQKKALSLPGSTEYLYAGETPSTHGRQPGHWLRWRRTERRQRAKFWPSLACR